MLFAARVGGSCLLYDAILHVLPVNALFASPFTLITGMHPYERESQRCPRYSNNVLTHTNNKPTPFQYALSPTSSVSSFT